MGTPVTLTPSDLSILFEAMPTRGFFCYQLLKELGAPVTKKNMIALLAWVAGEGTRALNNPLATTKAGFGGTDFNSTGVKNYPTFQLGMRATVATLHLTPYKDIIAALMKGDNIQHVVNAVIASPWGTHSLPWQDANANYNFHAHLAINS